MNMTGADARLDRAFEALAELQAPSASGALRQRLLDVQDRELPRPVQPRRPRLRTGLQTRGHWRWGGVLAGAFAAGLAIGFSPLGGAADPFLEPVLGVDAQLVLWTEEIVREVAG